MVVLKLICKMNKGCKICNLGPTTKTFFHRVQLFALICMLALIYYVIYIYDNSENMSHEQTFESESINNKKDFVLLTYGEENIDTDTQLQKFVMEAKQNLKLPDEADNEDNYTIYSQENIYQQRIDLPDTLDQNQNANKDDDKYKKVKPAVAIEESKNSYSQQITKPADYTKKAQNINQDLGQEKEVNSTDNVKKSINPLQQKTQSSNKPKEVQKANQITNQQKVVKLCDPEKELKIKTYNNQLQKASSKSDQVKRNQTCRDPGINTTHVLGILMEPVNVEYAKNIFFSLKTTHKYYTKRLFPLMLTWLQTVDRKKVR